MKADVRKAVGCVYIVLRAESGAERALLEDVRERRDWKLDGSESVVVAGRRQLQEIRLAPTLEVPS